MPDDELFWVRFTIGGLVSLLDDVKSKLTKEEVSKLYDASIALDWELRKHL